MDLHESEYRVCPPREALDYPHINSCMTVTARLQDGTRVGAHLVRSEWRNTFDSWKQLARATATVANPVVAIITAGAQACWTNGATEEDRPISTLWQESSELFPKAELQCDTRSLEGTVTVNADGTVQVTP